jgi:hypothetical protein
MVDQDSSTKGSSFHLYIAEATTLVLQSKTAPFNVSKLDAQLTVDIG